MVYYGEFGNRALDATHRLGKIDTNICQLNMRTAATLILMIEYGQGYHWEPDEVEEEKIKKWAAKNSA